MSATRSSDRDAAAPLRIAVLAELYHPSVGGQEVFFQELSETLVRRGHSVDVYCIGHSEGLAAEETINGVRVHRNPNGGRYKKPLIPALRRNWTDILKYSAGVRKVVATESHDFYLLNQWPLMHALALPKKSRARSGLHWCEIRTDPVLSAAQRRLPRLVGSNFSISEAVADEIYEQSGRSCVVLPSGLVRTNYRSADRADRSGVLYVGRLAPHKNLPLLIDAFALAVERGLTGDLTIGGDGPARADVEAYAARSPVAGRIKVLGSVSEEQKIDLLSRAAIFVMPSIREGFPRVVSEAMASGLPVVTGDFVGNGTKEVVGQYGAGIVCGAAPSDFAEAIQAAEVNWDKYSQAGLAAAQNLDWSTIADTLEARIREVIESDSHAKNR